LVGREATRFLNDLLLWRYLVVWKLLRAATSLVPKPPGQSLEQLPRQACFAKVTTCGNRAEQCRGE